MYIFLSNQLFMSILYTDKHLVPDKLEYFWFFSLSLFHSLFHGCNDRVCLVFCSMFRTLLRSSYKNKIHKSKDVKVL